MRNAANIPAESRALWSRAAVPGDCVHGLQCQTARIAVAWHTSIGLSSPCTIWSRLSSESGIYAKQPAGFCPNRGVRGTGRCFPSGTFGPSVPLLPDATAGSSVPRVNSRQLQTCPIAHAVCSSPAFAASKTIQTLRVAAVSVCVSCFRGSSCPIQVLPTALCTAHAPPKCPETVSVSQPLQCILPIRFSHSIASQQRREKMLPPAPDTRKHGLFPQLWHWYELVILWFNAPLPDNLMCRATHIPQDRNTSDGLRRSLKMRAQTV